MPINLHFILLSVLFTFTACQARHDNHDEVKIIQMPEMSKEILLPTKMWDLIMGGGFGKENQKASGFAFAPISVKLEEKNLGVLVAPAMVFNFPKGGGTIDLSKYIKSNRGTFHLSFTYEGFSHPESLQIYYVSRTRQRKLDGDIYGSGCGKFYDIKNFLFSGRKLELNVTRDRHVSAVGGHFVFSYMAENQNRVAQVEFEATNRPDLFCQEKP